MEHAKKVADKIYEDIKDSNKNVQLGDVAELIKTGIMNPELLGESLGYMAALFVPLLGWTKGAKAVSEASKEISKVEQVYKAEMAAAKATGGSTAAIAAKAKEGIAAAKAAQGMSDVGFLATKLATNNAGLLNVVAGDVNDQADVFRTNNEGVAPAATDLLRMTAIATAATAIDRIAFTSTLQTPGMFKALQDTLKYVPEGEAMKAVAATGRALGAAVVAGGVEGLQEYSQTLAEVFNKTYNTDKYGDNVWEVLTNKEAQVEAILGAGMGIGMGAEMSLAKSVIGNTSFSAEGIVDGINKGMEFLSKGMTGQNPLASGEESSSSGTEVPTEARERAATVQSALAAARQVNNNTTAKPSQVPSVDLNTITGDDVLRDILGNKTLGSD
jgi:hypothetical protein